VVREGNRQVDREDLGAEFNIVELSLAGFDLDCQAIELEALRPEDGSVDILQQLVLAGAAVWLALYIGHNFYRARLVGGGSGLSGYLIADISDAHAGHRRVLIEIQGWVIIHHRLRQTMEVA